MPRATGNLVRAALASVETDLAFGLDAIVLSAQERLVHESSVRRSAPESEPVRSDPDRQERRAVPVAAGPEESSRLTALAELRDRHDRECPHCTTATGHTRTVFGEGSPSARLVFIGEAPGETEDRLGRPFVGRAGEKLDEMIRGMGLRRQDVYIANVLKSRPPENRTPLQHEVDACGPYLAAQLRIIRPAVIVTLGGPATKLLLKTDLGITRLRGIWAEYRDSALPELGGGAGGDLVIPVMPTFHPAYLLRNYTIETRRQVWQDLQSVLKKLGNASE